MRMDNSSPQEGEKMWNPVWVSRNGDYGTALLRATVLFFITGEK
jgi:hypothetical protein